MAKVNDFLKSRAGLNTLIVFYGNMIVEDAIDEVLTSNSETAQSIRVIASKTMKVIR